MLFHQTTDEEFHNFRLNGFTGTINDMQFKALGDLGYTGSLTDRVKSFMLYEYTGDFHENLRDLRNGSLLPAIFKPELVANGTFDVNTAGWTVGNAATLSVQSGALRVEHSGTNNPFANYVVTGLTVGRIYTATGTIVGSSSATARMDLDNGGDGNDNLTGGSVIFTALNTTVTIQCYALGATLGGYGDFDNISVK